MTDLILVRHGETIWHAENRYAGRSDIDLTPRGLEQAAGLTRWAETAGLSGIWASDLSRARRTAEGCAEATGHELMIDPRLRELDFGEGEGLTGAEMEAAFPEARKAFQTDPAASPLPGGEDPFKAAERFVQCLYDIAEEQPNGRVLVVAHTTAIRLSLCRLLGIPLGEYRRVFPSLRNCALTTIRLQGQQAGLLEYNATAGPLTEPSVAGPPAASPASSPNQT
ncbi:MAG: histidine phosphatase family protein [Actinomycetota bacterium]|nr:histidine phosphatase family protein [Actinomycetota bacterium]